MILVDVYVPAMDKVYDFRLDETASVAQIMKEMEEIFMKKVKETKMEKQQEFMLCSMEQKEVLPIYKTPSECRIKDGSRLMLV